MPIRRQDDGNRGSELAQPTSQTSASSQSQTVTQSGTQTPTSSRNLTQTGTTIHSSTNFRPRPTIPRGAPAGTLTITQPPQLSTSYYKIAPSQFITFGWTFSYLLVTPSHLTVSAVCENGNTYPVGPTDGIIPGTATSVVWDTYSYQTSHPNLPLAQAKYTLKIWGDHGPYSPYVPGVLTPNSALQFALYTPQPYAPIEGGWSCGGCSGAVSQYVSHPAFGGIVATLLIMLLSGSALVRRF